MTAIDIVAGRFPFGVCVLHLKGKQIGIIYIYLTSEKIADHCRINLVQGNSTLSTWVAQKETENQKLLFGNFTLQTATCF